MKKSKKLLSLVVVFALIIFCFVPIKADAKKTVKLSATSKTVEVGKTVKITISGASSVKWSVSNNLIKIEKSTKKYAKLKGVSVGTGYLKAKVGSKLFKCKITVKDNNSTSTNITNWDNDKPSNPTNDSEVTDTGVTTVVDSFDSTEAESKISATYYNMKNKVVGIFTNNYKYDVSITPKMVFYDVNGKMLDSSTDYNYCLGVGKTCALYFSNPYDSDYNYIDYAEYKVSLNVEKSYYVDLSENISVDSNVGTSSVMIEFTNKTGKKIDALQASIVYYDKNGKVIGYDYCYPKCEKANSVDVASISLPYDEITYDDIDFASYKIFINYAYQY